MLGSIPAGMAFAGTMQVMGYKGKVAVLVDKESGKFMCKIEVAACLMISYTRFNDMHTRKWQPALLRHVVSSGRPDQNWQRSSSHTLSVRS